MKYASIGSISSGTLKPEDLIPAFAYELKKLRGALPRYTASEVRKFEWSPDIYEDPDELLDQLHNHLDDHAPPYCFFGAHQGDGADFGFWPYTDFQQCMQDDGVPIVDDLSKVEKGYRGEVLHVNDHGNCTLYVAMSKGKFKELWSIV